MMKNLNFFLLPLFLIIVGCPDQNPGGNLKLMNNSDEIVYFYSSPDFSTGHFPDIALPMEKPIGFQQVKAFGSTGKFEDPDWVEIYSQLPEDKFTVYVFSKDVVDTTPWETIRDDYLILERFDITLEELKASDYTVIYSP